MLVNRVNRSQNLASGLLAGMLVLGGLLGNVQAAAVTIPYYETFESGTTLGDYPDITFTAPADWSIVSNGAQINYSGGGAIGAAAVQVTPAVSTPIIVSTEFSVSAASFGSDAGLALFGSTNTFSLAAGISHYLLDLKPRATGSTSTMRILKVNGTSPTQTYTSIVGDTSIPLLTLGDTYKLTAVATPVFGGLDLSLTLQNLTTLTTPSNISGVDASPLTGTYFALRNRVSVAGTNTVNYHDFSISAVPEPSSFGLLAMGLVGLRYFRRRKV